MNTRFVYVSVFWMVCMVGEQPAAQTPSYDDLKDELEDWDGAVQAKIHCVRCHIFPEPDVLSSDTWPYVLDLMGLYFGIDDGDLLKSLDQATREDLYDTPKYPLAPIIGPFQWAAIRDFYESSNGSGNTPSPPEGIDLENFSTELIYTKEAVPVTAMVKIDDASPGFYLASEFNRLDFFDGLGALQSSEPVPGAVVQLNLEKSLQRATVIGRMHPSNRASGSLLEKESGGDRWQVVLQDLHRPVHLLSEDFNGDGKIDFFINEFGHYVGSSSLFTAKKDRTFRRHSLRLEPGSISAVMYPASGNKQRRDLWVLNAQARQELTLYRNLGGMSFEPETLLQKPPSFGYTQMLLADLTGDGIEELVTINGDNADLPGPPLKAYHGVRVYSILEGPTLKEETFLYLPGAFQATVDDFDENGLVDLALVSYFPDSRQQKQGFVLFKNQGNFVFERHTLDAGAVAPWMTIDSGDIDGDGDTDIVVGSAYIKRAPANTSEEPLPAAMILRNNYRP